MNLSILGILVELRGVEPRTSSACPALTYFITQNAFL